MTVSEAICKINKADEIIGKELEAPIPNQDLVEILQDYIYILSNMIVKR